LASTPVQYSPAPPPNRPLALVELELRHQKSRDHFQPDKPSVQRFTLFPALPTEIRDKIWKESLPGPRLIQVGWNLWTEELEDGSAIDYYKCISNSNAPAMLHTCHDSREIALKFFRLSFADDLKYPVYFDIQRDILVFHSLPTLCLFIRNGDNPHRFQEGCIPTIALDLPVSLFNDAELAMHWAAEDFFYPYDGPVNLTAEWKFGLLDEIIVLTRTTYIEAREGGILSALTDHNYREVVNGLQTYLDELQRAFKRSGNDEIRKKMPQFGIPKVHLMTQMELLRRQS